MLGGYLWHKKTRLNELDRGKGRVRRVDWEVLEVKTTTLAIESNSVGQEMEGFF